MQIAVNTRLLLRDKLDGTGWFAYQTLKRIAVSNPSVHFVFLFDRPFDESFIFSDNITPIVLSPQARHPFLWYAWLQFSVKDLLRNMKPDLFLSPDGFICLGATCRQLPVIHDINFHHYPADHKWLNAKYYNYFFPRFARTATRIATVSEFSRNEISSNYEIPSEKTDVVYNGINPFFRPLTPAEINTTRARYTGGEPYFIYVGSLHPRKNIPNLIRAYAHFRKTGIGKTKLMLAGPSFWGMNEIREAIAACGYTEDIIITGRLADDELVKVLGSAAALTFVSYYEGFGIPLLEAMACGIPVIASNITSLPEVAGDAAMYVNPMDITEISQAMQKIVTDNSLRADLVQKGYHRKDNFSWDRSSKLLWESINRTINSKI